MTSKLLLVFLVFQIFAKWIKKNVKRTWRTKNVPFRSKRTLKGPKSTKHPVLDKFKRTTDISLVRYNIHFISRTFLIIFIPNSSLRCTTRTMTTTSTMIMPKQNIIWILPQPKRFSTIHCLACIFQKRDRAHRIFFSFRITKHDGVQKISSSTTTTSRMEEGTFSTILHYREYIFSFSTSSWIHVTVYIFFSFSVKRQNVCRGRRIIWTLTHLGRWHKNIVWKARRKKRKNSIEVFFIYI